MSEPRTLCCPICGRELGIPPHEAHMPWTSSQIWLVHKLKRWMTHKAIGSLFGVGHQAIERLLKNGYGATRLQSPAVAIMITKAPLAGSASVPMAAQNGGNIETEVPMPAATDHQPMMVQPPIAAGVL